MTFWDVQQHLREHTTQTNIERNNDEDSTEINNGNAGAKENQQ